MKKFYFILSILLLNLCSCSKESKDDSDLVSADGIYYGFVSNGICYNINTIDKTASIRYKTKKEELYSGNVAIPSLVAWNGHDYTVTAIGSHAFYNCNGLESVTIPNTVTAIEGFAFYGCTSLSFINIPNSVTTIQEGAFENCSGLTNIKVPNSVTIIGNMTFYGCSISSVKFEDGTNTCNCSNFSFKDAPIENLYIGRCIKDPYDQKYNGWKKSNRLQTLTIGSKLKEWSSDYCSDELTTVNSLITDPTQLIPSFSNIVYTNATLYVPTGTKSTYEKVSGWKQFLKIKEKDFSNGF